MLVEKKRKNPNQRKRRNLGSGRRRLYKERGNSYSQIETDKHNHARFQRDNKEIR